MPAAKKPPIPATVILAERDATAIAYRSAVGGPVTTIATASHSFADVPGELEAAVLAAGLWPFIPGGLVKAALAALLIPAAWKGVRALDERRQVVAWLKANGVPLEANVEATY